MPFLRVEVWTDLACASGTRLGTIADAAACTDRRQLDGVDTLTLTLPRRSDSWALIQEQHVLRVIFDDTFDEWRISAIDEKPRPEGIVIVHALAPLLDLNRGCVARTEADGSVQHEFGLGLTPSAFLSDVILPAAPAYFAAGTVDPTAAVDLAFTFSSPLKALRDLAQVAEAELRVRRNGTTNYLVDLVTAIGASAPLVTLRVGKNVEGFSRRRDATEQATRIYGKGGGEEGARCTIAENRWRVAAIAGTDVTLEDPNGGDGPIGCDDQLNGLYFREDGAASGLLVTDSVVATQKVTLSAVTGLAVGDVGRFEANAAGDDLTALEAPAEKATYGLLVGVLERTDLPPVRNLVGNTQLTGAYTSGLPSGWSKVGTPTTAEETATLYTRRGGKSCKVTATANGQGIMCAAFVVRPTADQPYFSAFATVILTAGKVRVEFVDSAGHIYPDGTTQKAWTPELSVWKDLGYKGADLFAVGATTGTIRILADGGAATFYVDSAQCTQGAEQEPFFPGVGATALWQAVNAKLAVSAAPQVSIRVELLDRYRLNRDLFAGEELVLGGGVRYLDTALGDDVTTRILALERDVFVAMDSAVELSNRPEDLTDILVRPKRLARKGTKAEVPMQPDVGLSTQVLPGKGGKLQVVLSGRPAGAAVYYIIQAEGDTVPVVGLVGTNAFTLYNAPFALSLYEAARIQLSAYAQLGSLTSLVRTWLVDKDTEPSVSVALSENPGGTLVVKWTPDDDVALVDLYRKKNGDDDGSGSPHLDGGGEGYPVVGAGPAVSITSLTRSGSVATATVASTAALAVGQVVVVAGAAAQTEYNGSHVLTGIPDNTHFTYAVTGTPATPAAGTITYKTAVPDQALSIGRCSPWPEGGSVARDGLPLGVTAAYGSAYDSAGNPVDGIGTRWWVDDYGAPAYAAGDLAAVLLVPLDPNLVPGAWALARRTMSGAATATLDSLVTSAWTSGVSCADGASCTVTWTGSGLVDGTHHVHVFYRINGSEWTELAASPEAAPATNGSMTFDENALYGASGDHGGTDNVVEFKAELQLDSDHSAIDERTDAGTTLSSVICAGA